APWNDWARRRLGRALYEANQPDQGQQHFAAECQRRPDSTALLLDWAEGLRWFGRQERQRGAKNYEAYFEEAEEKFRHAIKLDTLDTASLGALGRLLLERDHKLEALEQLDCALYLDRYDWEAYAIKGDVLREMNYDDAAVKAYERALAIQPNAVPVLAALGKQLQRMEKHDEAIRRLERAVELDPLKARSAYLLARLLRQVG